MHEYLMYLVGDDTNITNLLMYLSCAREFENALSAYNQPIIKTNGGMFGFGEKRYTIGCSFDLNLFNALERFQKLDLYEYIRKFVHNNANKLKMIIYLLEQATHLDTDPLTILHFFTQLKTAIDRIIRNTIYLSLRKIDSHHVSGVFDTLFTVLESLEQQVTNILQDIRTSETEHNNDNGDSNNHSDSGAHRRTKTYCTRSRQRSKPY